MKRILVLLLICLIGASSYAQEESAFEVATMLQNAEALESNQFKKRRKIIFKALEIAEQEAYDSLSFKANLELSYTYLTRSMTDSAIHYSIEAKNLGENRDRQDWVAEALLRIARIYRHLELYDESDKYVIKARDA
jgi:hypothetical protein